MFRFKVSNILTVLLTIMLTAHFASPLARAGDDSDTNQASKKIEKLQKAVQELIAMAPRPTIEDIEIKLNPWPEKNPFTSPEQLVPAANGNQYVNTVVQNIRRTLPAFIAKLEKAFPGGTFAFLGRDFFFRDAHDVFSLGLTCFWKYIA